MMTRGPFGITFGLWSLGIVVATASLVTGVIFVPACFIQWSRGRRRNLNWLCNALIVLQGMLFSVLVMLLDRSLEAKDQWEQNEADPSFDCYNTCTSESFVEVCWGGNATDPLNHGSLNYCSRWVEDLHATIPTVAVAFPFTLIIVIFGVWLKLSTKRPCVGAALPLVPQVEDNDDDL
eukprot:TRINITY_DN1923_c0_g1_i2.p1 TRINITY_DN1923_c0_g1~~TRINITY_DN1923_c0_g1_i2.p1  ORF type:complete len:178 (-),score=10.55 TRINITY_DN1923_c0_g1_i2:26-559(-)